MIRTITVLAADGEGSPLGDLIRQNDTLTGFICIGLVVLVVVALLTRSKK